MTKNTNGVTDEAADGEAVPAQDAATDAGQATAETIEAKSAAVPTVADDVRRYVDHMLKGFHDEMVKRGQIPPPPHAG